MLQLFFVAGVALAPPPIQRVEDLRYIKATGVWELHLPDGALVQPPKPAQTWEILIVLLATVEEKYKS